MPLRTIQGKQLNTNLTGSFSGSFVGNLTGTASYATTAQTLLGSVVSASYAATASYALTAQTLLGSVVSASYAATASYLDSISGSEHFLPVFNGTNSQVASTIFQSGSYTAIRNSTGPENPLAPDILYVSGEGVDTYNLLSAHGDQDGYVQVNVQNYSTGVSASSDIVATADNGNENSVYIDMGINGSAYTNTGYVGAFNDAYMYSTGRDLFIGNASAGHNVTIFNGGLDTTEHARVFINDGGSVGINSNNITAGNPEALLVDSISGTTYNIITARANVDNYAQLNVHNISNGTRASSDIVASNDTATEVINYVDMGINSSTHLSDPSFTVGAANDTYLLSTGNSHYIGSATSGDLKIFTGADFNDDKIKIRVKANNQHEITGSLSLSGSVTAVSFTGSIASASYATSASFANRTVSASYVSGYVLTSSTSSMSVLSSSFATSASWAPVQVSSSYASTASYVAQAQTASYAVGYVLNSSTSSMTVSSASFAGTASYAPSYVLNSATSSMLSPYVLTSSTGSMTVLSSSFAISSSRSVSSSFASQATNATNATNATSASYAVTSSYINPLQQNVVVTGSLAISGSTTQIGNNTLQGLTTLSGSVVISGNTTITGSITATNQTASFGYVSASFVDITGKQTVKGYTQYIPTNDIVPVTTQGGYVYSSGSQGDLYFAQTNGSSVNTVRLRWLEGNMYSGLLSGGVIATASSTVFTVSSGSGIIVNLSGSLASDPYPTVNYLTWSTLSSSIEQLSGSYDQSFVSIEPTGSTGRIKVQGVPYDDGQFNTIIPIGNVIHQNRSTINATATYPSVAYGYKQRSSDFIRAFGSLKLSGLDTAVSGSSTGSLQITAGTSYTEGRNYVNDVNNPSYITDPGQPISKIYRYYQSGSEWKYQTNAGVGFQTIDPTQYSNNGTLTAVPGTGANREFSIQRVYYFPGGATRGIYVYYGNATYPTAADAIANIPYETFKEAPNTAAGAVLSSYLIVRNNADFTVADSYSIRPGGLFRSVGGSGGGSSAVTQTLAGLSDVTLTSPTTGQPLVYNSNTSDWNNSNSLTASLFGTASYATVAQTLLGSVVSASYAATASVLLGSVQSASYSATSVTASYALTAQTLLGSVVSASYALTASYALNGGGASTPTFPYTGSAHITGSLTVTGSVSTGDNTSATGWYSHAEGLYTIASGSYSHAEGELTIASGSYSHAEGYYTVAQGAYSHAEGSNTIASGHYSHAEGSNTTASGSKSHTEGQNTQALGLSSHAEGDNALALGVASHAEGYYTRALGNYQHVQGQFNVTSSVQSAFIHGNGVNDTSRSNLIYAAGSEVQITGSLKVSGSILGTSSYASQASTASYVAGYVLSSVTSSMSVATASYATIFPYTGSAGITGSLDVVGQYTQGLGNIATGSYSHAEGSSSLASGIASHAEGLQTTASGNFSHAEGSQAKATGNYSHAEGQLSTSPGVGSHAEGYSTNSTGLYSHAEGYGGVAIGNYSHIEGQSNQALGTTSHAEGESTKAQGDSSHAEGLSTVAQGKYSHAEGSGSVAFGTGSHSEGLQTSASGNYQHVQGQFNLTSSIVSAFIHGNGTSNTNRSNLIFAHDSIVEISGSLAVSGSITGSLFGTASYTLVAQTLLGSVASSSFASSASYVNILNQNVVVTGSLTIGSGSVGSDENTLIIGPAPNGGVGEGGQVLLSAKGGGYDSASMFDNYQNRTRLLRGTNAGSDAEVMSWNLHTKQVSLPAYNNVTSFPGTSVASLAVDSSGNVITIAGAGGGTVTSVSASGTVSGITLGGGPITTSGTLTLSGNISGLTNTNLSGTAGITNANLANPSTRIGTTDIALGATGSSLAGLASISATSITGSLLGTSSYALQTGNASTASYITGYVPTSATSSMSVLSSSFATSASWAPIQISASYASTASYVVQAQTASFAQGYVLTSSTSSMSVLSSSFAISSSRSVSSSYALTASYVDQAQTASFAQGYVLTSSTASMLAPYVLTSSTSSMFVSASTFAISSSRSISSSYSVSSSYSGNSTLASTASYVAGYVLTSSTSSMSVASSSYTVSASYALTASYALNGGGGTTITTQEEGVTLSTTVNTINFTGAGVTATGAGSTTTVNIPGGAGASFPYTGSAQITGSLGVTGSVTITGSLNVAAGITGSLLGTASFALSASWAPGGSSGLKTKSGGIVNTSFAGNPRKYTVTFATAFPDNNYGATITGEDARSWTIESKVSGSFIVNTNSNTGLSGTTFWQAVAYGETT